MAVSEESNSEVVDVSASLIHPCLFDPVKLAPCESSPYKPPYETCEKCLSKSIVDSLSFENQAEALRWFIGFRSLFAVMAKDKGDAKDGGENDGEK